VAAEETDRSAGFLTQTEREYLLGEWAPGDSEPGEWTEQQERSKRSDITTRTRHAIADIALLQQNGDDDLTSNVIERAQNPDDIPTFHEPTLENAERGLSEFLIRLVLDEDDHEVDQLVNELRDEDWSELFEEMDEAVQESKRTAERHSDFLEPATNQLQQYAEANDISKEEMKDAIEILWSE
jgi:hypothetical protein